MTKSHFSLLFAFAVTTMLASAAVAQGLPITGTVYPDAVATSVVESAPYHGSAAPYYGSAAPVVSQTGCASCGQAASYTPAPQITGPHSKSCSGCCLPGPTQAPGFAQLPVESCCGNTGRLNIPPLTTPLRYDTPPVGKAVGRPIFGRWNGY